MSTVIHGIIWSYGLIPEVQLYESEEAAEQAFREAFSDVFSTPIERNEMDGFTEDQAVEEGFMAHHDSEVRLDSFHFPGVTFAADEMLPILKMLRNQYDEKVNYFKSKQPLTWFSLGSKDEDFMLIRKLLDRFGIAFLKSHDPKSKAEYYPRICSVTGAGMHEGWVWGEGAFYTKYKHTTVQQLQQDYPGIWQQIHNLYQTEGRLLDPPADTAEDQILTWAYDEGLLYWTEWEWDDSDSMKELF